MNIKPIETQYKGYRFRSRLEARWAVFFDALSVPWEYEKEGYDLGEAGWYLPDFWLPGRQQWIEIKGNLPVVRELIRVYRLPALTGYYAVLVSGVPGQEHIYLPEGQGKWMIFPESDIPSYCLWCDLICRIPDGGWHPQHKFRDEVTLCPNIDRAYAAARSARFEHGETPRL